MDIYLYMPKYSIQNNHGSCVKLRKLTESS